MDLFHLGVTMANAFADPDNLKKLNRDKPAVLKLEDVHPLLRPTREKNRG